MHAIFYVTRDTVLHARGLAVSQSAAAVAKQSNNRPSPVVPLCRLAPILALYSVHAAIPVNLLVIQAPVPLALCWWIGLV
mmetsp:Transcript_20985/g.34602  ORF Transcript_20985/g.34602 Transcript_20985/m.34602 type:complete len:80 (-) Transcript_20985:921-1160(-)